MNLMEKISRDEMNMISAYRRDYAFSGSGHYGNFAPNEKVLDIWQEAKNEYLAKMLNGNLILERNVEYKVSESEIKGNMSHMLEETESREFFWTFNAWAEKYCKDKNIRPWYDNDYYGITSLLSVNNLATNTYTGDSFEIELANGHHYKIQTGAKLMKVIGKICESYEIDGFEKFRIAHSMILNDVRFHGKMCISIHPLDFMTLSDNDSDWSSCMSWNNHGCYRQGTVEMMNSPMVVVAYLKSSSSDYDIDGYQWNNKKWRELFIVDPRFILNIKSYPFHNEFLTSYAMNWLKELVTVNLGWSFSDEKISYSPGNDFYIDGNRYRICPETRYMYNDFYNGPYDSFAYFASDLEPNRYAFNYSGPSQCMVCGDTSDDGAAFEAEGDLACEDCEPTLHCECCGDHVDEDYAYYLDDIVLCEDCYYDHRIIDDFTGKEHYDENMTTIHVAIPKESEDEDESHEGNVKVFRGYYRDEIYTAWENPDKHDSYFENYFTKGVHYKTDRYGRRYYYVRLDEVIRDAFGSNFDCDKMAADYISLTDAISKKLIFK